MNIIKKLCNNFGERGTWTPDVIVWHISGGTDKSMDSWFHTPNSQASAHYGIDLQNGDIYQYVEENKKSWTCGNVKNPTSEIVKLRPNINPNLYTLNIENEGYDLSNASELQLKSLFELTKDLAKRYNIPLDRKHIIAHWEIDSVTRNYCPSPNHLLMDKLVAKLNDEQVVSVPRKLLEEISKYI
jgi:N-acetyl-anhydromuramyl-L-alanine amidase AmpD